MTSSGGWGTCRCKYAIFYVHELQFLEVIESSVIYNLPQQFNGGLCSIGFEHGHIDVINKDDHLFSGRRS